MKMKCLLVILALIPTITFASPKLNIEGLSSGDFVTIGGVYESKDTAIHFSNEDGESLYTTVAYDKHFVVRELCNPETVTIYGRRNNIICFIK